ncbi:MAG: ComEA family DNA-binding protein [Flavobacterium sp.]
MKQQPKFFYPFSRGQRTGVIALVLVIVIIQVAYYFFESYDFSNSAEKSQDEKEWLALQPKIDSLKALAGEKRDTIYPFNPNFISDYKGYTLGLSLAEIKRLHDFRKAGKYVNSAEDFKNVTKVSDAQLAKISPYFKFPDWVSKKGNSPKNVYRDFGDDKFEKSSLKSEKYKKKNPVKIDLNSALEEDLDKVFGIGPAFAKKILRKRAQLGAFVSVDQMDEFAEFSPDAIAGLKKNFIIGPQPQVTKVNINSSSLNQLAYFPYFNRSIAKSIITKRSMKGKISNIEELLDINDFPVDKVKIIALYLEF